MAGTGFSATVFLVMMLFAFLVAILWVLMPFAIFGTKDLLRALIREQKKTNELLQTQVNLQQAQADRAREIRDQTAALRTGEMAARS